MEHSLISMPGASSPAALSISWQGYSHQPICSNMATMHRYAGSSSSCLASNILALVHRVGDPDIEQLRFGRGGKILESVNSWSFQAKSEPSSGPGHLVTDTLL